MRESRSLEPGRSDGEDLEFWLTQGDGTHSGLLSALLDAHWLFQEEYLSPETLRPLFGARWPEGSLAREWEELSRLGLLEPGPENSCAVPGHLRRALANALEGDLWRQPLYLPGGTASFPQLIAGFTDYCRSELKICPDAGAGMEVWGGIAFRLSGRQHLVLYRPDLLRLSAHPDAHVLVVCPLPAAVAMVASSSFSSVPALRNRLALYDVEGGVKINLTRSELFVYFERYLRQVHGLRMAPSRVLTDSLRDSGLLNLDKG